MTPKIFESTLVSAPTMSETASYRVAPSTYPTKPPVIRLMLDTETQSVTLVSP